MQRVKNICLSFLLCALASTCGEYQLEDETLDESQKTPHTFQVVTRSTQNAPINYPLSVFLFDEDNVCIRQETIPDASTPYSSTLPEGVYTLVLLSGMSSAEYEMPLEVSVDSYISLKDSYFSHTPLQMAQARIVLTKSTTVQMTLSYVVSSVNFVLNDVPDEATDVLVHVSPVSSAITFNGDYKDDSQSCPIVCRKEGDQWLSDTVYLFPNESSSTRLSVQVNLPEGNKTYGYTYQSALLPGYPYQFTGNYQGGITLNGEFQAEGWKPVISVEFGMNEVVPDDPGTSGGDTGGSENTDTEIPSLGADTYLVDRMPEAGDIWEYFYVWQITSVSETESEAVIISPNQGYDTVEYCLQILSSYSKGGISDWRVFTKEEAKSFRDQFWYSLDELNTLLRDNGMMIFVDTEGERYLCNNCNHSFSFTSNTISTAGAKKQYYLRPVKTVRLKLK